MNNQKPAHPDIVEKALSAEKRIRKYIKQTPLEYSPHFSELTDCHVYLKLENYQIPGSFKLRGVSNFILSLSRSEKQKGLVAASTGNHAAAFAYILNKFGLKGIICLPENISDSKRQALSSYDIELKQYGADCVETEMYSRNIAEENGYVYVPPYNHIKIIAGQATIAIELLQQLNTIDTVFVPVGGGGLVSGIGGYLKESGILPVIIGCQPENSPVMYESVRRGKIVEMESLPTLPDRTAGGIEKDSLTFDFCRRYVDDFILVSEGEIEEAIRFMNKKHQMLIEGAAALTVAAYKKNSDSFKCKNVVLIISGNKIAPKSLRNILGNST